VFFLFKQIDRIYDAWDEGDYEHALSRALRLIVGLPTDIKEALWDEKQEITKELNQAYSSQGVDFFTTHLVRNREGKRVSMMRLGPLMDKMIRLLDEKKWLERGALKPRYETKTRLTA